MKGNCLMNYPKLKRLKLTDYIYLIIWPLSAQSLFIFITQYSLLHIVHISRDSLAVSSFCTEYAKKVLKDLRFSYCINAIS